MGTERDGNGEDPTPPPRITLKLSECGDLWVVTGEETGVTTQAETREEALAMIDEAVALHKGEAGEPIDDGRRSSKTSALIPTRSRMQASRRGSSEYS